MATKISQSLGIPDPPPPYLENVPKKYHFLVASLNQFGPGPLPNLGNAQMKKKGCFFLGVLPKGEL